MQFGGARSWDDVERREREHHDRLQRSGHPAFELDDRWTGPRALGDVSWTGYSLDHVGIAHGVPWQPDEPEVHVHTLVPDGRGLDDRGSDDDPAFDVLARHGGRSALRAAPAGMTVDVDDAPVAASRAAGSDEEWLVELVVGDVVLLVEGRGLGLGTFTRSHGLRRVDDLNLRFEARLDQLRRFHQP